MKKIEDWMVAQVKLVRMGAITGANNGNTAVALVRPNTAEVRLHGNHIATVYGGGMRFTLAGWNTNTTRSRVNALLNAFARGHVTTCKGQAHYSVYGPIGNDWWIATGPDGTGVLPGRWHGNFPLEESK